VIPAAGRRLGLVWPRSDWESRTTSSPSGPMMASPPTAIRLQPTRTSRADTCRSNPRPTGRDSGVSLPSPEARVPSPESRVPSPRTRDQGPETRDPGPLTRDPGPGTPGTRGPTRYDARVPVLASGLDYLDLNFLGRPEIIATGVLHGTAGVALIDPGPSTS